MSLANCKQCGKLYIQAGRTNYCVDCKAKQDVLYKKVRDYIKNNPKSTVMDVHQNTGIPVSTVLELQKEEYVPYSYG
jgi:hypothetical protein